MIYRNLMQSLSILSTVMLTLMLAGCGGAASSEDTPSSNNKPNQSSLAASSQASEILSSLAASSTTSATSSSVPATPTSSGVKSSAGSSYTRASRSSLSSASDLPDDITTPEETVDHPPSVPTELRLIAVSTAEVAIQWTAATDDKGVSNYEIRRNNIYIGISPSTKTSFVDSGLTDNTTYIYTVRAVDAIGNRSGFSLKLVAQTQPGSSSSSSTQSTNSSSKSSKSSTSTPSISSRSSSSSANSSAATLSVEWRIPNKRENGDYIELYEIGGYELRHIPLGSSTYSNTIITNATTTRFIIPASTLKDTYEVAAFDVNGLYSRFIKLTPH